MCRKYAKRHSTYMTSTMLRCSAGVLALVVLALVIPTASAACNVSKCIEGPGTLAPRNTSTLEAYYACLDSARGVLAFQCRCSLHIRDCLRSASGGNCTDTRAYEACGQFLVAQNAGCSLTLCESSAAYVVPVVAILVSSLVSLLVVY